MKDLPPLLTVRILAPVLDISEHGVRAMIRRGELPASRLGNKYIVRRDALERHLIKAERTRRPAEDRASRILRALPAPRRRKRP